MKVMIKEFIRSLNKNLTRFLSILFIIALGVGFFAGINATKPDMIKSATKYYNDNNLMDLRAMNPLGYSPADIQGLRQIKNIEKMQVSYTKDIFMVKDDSKLVVRLFSMDLATYSDPDTMNKVILKEGRLPQKSGEIVLAKGQYLDMDLALGQTIRFVEDEGNDINEVVKNQDYTIVGFIESPLYISFEREFTNLGNGQIVTYVYMSQEDFTMAEPSEYFFAISGARALAPESAAYKDLVDSVKTEVDELGKTVMTAETADLTAELQKGRDELTVEKTKAETELSDAEAKLNQAEADLAVAQTTLVDEELKGRQKIADGRAELMTGRQELLDARLKYNTAYLKWQEGYNTYQTGKAKLDASLLELAQGKAELDAAKLQIDSGKAMLAQNEATLESSKQQIELFGEVVNGLKVVKKSLPDTPTLSQEEYDQLLLDLEGVSPETASYIRAFIPMTSPDSTAAIRNFLDTSLDTIDSTYQSAKTSFDAGQAQYDQAKKDLTAGEKKYNSGLAEYNAGKKKLDAAKTEAEKGRKELDAGKSKLDQAKKELDDGDIKLAQGQLDLDKGLEELETKVADGKTKIAQGQADLKAGRTEFNVQKADAQKKLAEADVKLLDAQRKILDVPDKWFVNTRDGNPSYTSWFDNGVKIGRVAMVFPFFFFLVAALVSLTTITRMVEEERTQAGTLKAMGYTPIYIAAKYISYALLASLLGSILGLLIGFNLFPRVIIWAYQMMYHIPALVIEFNPFYALISIGLAVLSTVGAAMAAIFSEIRERPAALMMPKVPKAGKRIFLERITPLWSRLSFSRKVTFRNLFLYKKRFWMTVLGISGCTALILTGFGIKDSVDAIAANQFKHLFVYDQMVITDSKQPAPERDLNQLLGQTDTVKSYALNQTLNMKVHVAGSDRTYDTNLVIPEKPVRLSNFVILRNRATQNPLTLTDDGVIITEKLSELAGLRVGDQISYEDGQRRKFTAKINGITEQYVDNYIYISPAYYQSTHLMTPDYSTAWLNLTDEALLDEDATTAALMENKAVLGVIASSEISKNFDEQMQSLVYVVLVLIASAGALAFIVLFNLSNVNITERVRELATIKVLGFRDGEVSAYVYRENVFLTMFGALAGLGLGVALHKFIMRTMEIDNMMFGKNIQWSSFIYSLLITFLFAAIVNFFMHFSLKKINMVESLKSLE